MKIRIFTVFFACVMVFLFSACDKTSDSTNKSVSGGVKTDNNISEANSDDIDVDLTALSSTMVYSKVYNMINEPESYLGKTVKMKGTFSVYEGEERNYYACLIADATACCSQGIEFVLGDDYTYPEDYPELGKVITVTGVFDTYMEGENLYCQLIGAKMSV